MMQLGVHYGKFTGVFFFNCFQKRALDYNVIFKISISIFSAAVGLEEEEPFSLS